MVAKGGRALSLLRVDAVSARFLGFAGSGFDHQGIGECAEEGDGDEGPDFEGGLAGRSVGARGFSSEDA